MTPRNPSLSRARKLHSNEPSLALLIPQYLREVLKRIDWLRKEIGGAGARFY